ncbi:MAG: hypothetical protein ACREWG_17100 [Gammaproteobacteria bacterium]
MKHALSTFIQGLFPAFRREPRYNGDTQEPALDLAGELGKVQRGLRRLSLASDQNNDLLRGLSGRFQDLSQTVLQLSGVRKGAVVLDEGVLLQALDRLEQARAAPALPMATYDLLDSVRASLLVAARWQAVAEIGAPPEGIQVRIAEVLPDASQTGFRIEQVLEQGYLRADGSLLRPAVVIAMGSRPTN